MVLAAPPFGLRTHFLRQILLASSLPSATYNMMLQPNSAGYLPNTIWSKSRMCDSIMVEKILAPCSYDDHCDASAPCEMCVCKCKEKAGLNRCPVMQLNIKPCFTAPPRFFLFLSLLASQSDAHTIAPHRDPNPIQSTYSSKARKTHDVIYF